MEMLCMTQGHQNVHRKEKFRNSPFYYLTEQTMKLLFNIELCNKWGIRYPTAFSLP